MQEYLAARAFRKGEQEAFNSLEKATEIYDKQKRGIKNIQTTDGFKEIIKFFEREMELYEAYFANGKDKERIQYMQGGYALCRNFLSFIKNITK